jgi:membrane protein implicated in regulation of membrane protease activity
MINPARERPANPGEIGNKGKVNMDRLMGKVSLALALLLLGAAPSWGQVPWAAAARAAKTMQYDRGTVETLRGTVMEVERLAPRRMARLSQVHLLLKTDRGTVTVKLGPESWLARHNFTLAPGDQVSIKGSLITRPRRIFLIAGEVKKGGQVLPLRDETGRPLWGRHRSQP